MEVLTATPLLPKFWTHGVNFRPDIMILHAASGQCRVGYGRHGTDPGSQSLIWALSPWIQPLYWPHTTHLAFRAKRLMAPALTNPYPSIAVYTPDNLRLNVDVDDFS